MALSKSIKEIRVVMVGTTGVGKSSVGNSLLNKKHFTSNTWAGSVTSKCKFGTHSLANGTKLVIVDTPGIFDESKSNMETSKEIIRCICLSSPGPHAFFFVLKIGASFTAEERDIIQRLKDIFGQDVMKYVIVVFTGKDNLEAEDMTIEEYLRKAPEDLMSLIAECGGRYAVINNRAPMAVRVKDIEGILQMVRRTMDDNQGKQYTGEMYASAEESINAKVQLLEEEELERKRELERKEKVLHKKQRQRRQQAEAEIERQRQQAEVEIEERRQKAEAKVAMQRQKAKEEIERQQKEAEQRQRGIEAKRRELELSKEVERLVNLKLEAEKEEKRWAEEFKQLTDDQKEERRQMQEDMRNREREMEEARKKGEEEREAERERQEKERQEELMIQRQRDEERIHKLEEEHRLKMEKLEEEAEEEKKRLMTEMEKLRTEDNRRESEREEEEEEERTLGEEWEIIQNEDIPQLVREQVQNDDDFVVKVFKFVFNNSWL